MPTSNMNDMPIVYFDIDSLRPDHIGCYGYEGPTTPHIDDLAADAVQFENAYVANSPCMPSRAALLSGRYGISNGIETHGEPVQVMSSPQWMESWNAPDCEYWTLPELFFKNRIRTGAVSSFPRHPSPWFYHIWHEFVQPQEPKTDGTEYFQTPRAETIADHALDFLNRHGNEDFFLYTQFWDPHAPYKRSETEIDRFRGQYLPDYPTTEMVESHQEWDAYRSAQQLGIEDRADLDDLLSAYDAEIRYADKHIGRIIDALRTQGLYEDTLIIITADHGEEFGEHGLYREHWSTHDGTQHVPLLVKPPADADVEPSTREHLITNVDLPPTLADYADLESPAGWQGCSLRPLIADSDVNWRDHIVVDHGLYTAQRAVRTSRWKYIHTYHPGIWKGTIPEQQLYDMHADPWEQNDIAENHPDLMKDLNEMMTVWAHEYIDRAEDALHRVARIGPTGYNLVKDHWDGT